ncbi:MAG: PAS domain S-box protein, partial [Dokdonella sp.]
MNIEKPPLVDVNDEVSALIETLHDTEQRLEKLTSGEVDSVANRVGRTLLLSRAQNQMRQTDAVRQATILNALPANIAMLDHSGFIVSVNEAWKAFARGNALLAPGYAVGLNYLDICDGARGDGASDANKAAEGIRSILGGGNKSFSLEYACHSPAQQRWFMMTVTPLSDKHPDGVVVMHINITDRKLAELSSMQLAAIVESSEDAIIGKDLNGVVTSWNKAAERIFRYTAGEIVGTSMYQLVPIADEDKNKEDHLLEKVRSGISVAHFETLGQTKEGKVIAVSVTASPIRDVTGKVVGMSKVVRDITSRNALQDSLRASEATMAAAQRIAHIGSWELKLANTNDIDANSLRWSEEMFRIAGYEPGAVKVSNEMFFRHVPDGEHEPIRQAVADAIAAHGSYSIVHRLIRPDGEERIVEEAGQISFDEKNGKPLSIIGTAHDITEQRRAAGDLAANAALLRQFIRHTPAAIAMLDTDMCYLQTSDRWLHDYHLGEREIVGKSHYEIFPDLPEEWKDIHRRVLAGNVERCDEAAFARADGSLDWLQWELRPWRKSDGDVGGLIMFTQVITERKRYEETLQRQRTELQALFDLLPAMIWFKDTKNRILRINKLAAQVLGMSIEDIEGRPAHEIYPVDAEKFYADDLQVIHSGKRKLAIVESLHDSHGDVRWVQTDKVPVCDPNGKVTGIIVMSQDITERKQTESTRDRLAMIVEATPDLISTSDAGGRLTYLNRAGRNALGVGLDEDVSRTSISDFVSNPASHPILIDGIPTATREGSWHGETTLQSRSGGEIP